MVKCDMCNKKAEVILDFLNVKKQLKYCMWHFNSYVFVRNLNNEIQNSLKAMKKKQKTMEDKE